MARYCIVIPAYNAAVTLGEAVESALRQNYEDYSVVVSDNASTDATTNLMTRFSSPHLRFVRHEARVGKTANWNRAFKLAGDCEYLVTLHSDDRLAPGCLRTLDSFTREKPALIHGANRSLDASGAAKRWHPVFPFGHSTTGDVAKELLLLNNIVCVAGVAIQHKAYHAIGGWPERYNYMQDFELWYRLADVGRIVYTPHVIGDYRHASEDKTRASLPGNLSESLHWFEERARLEMLPRLRLASLQRLSDYVGFAEMALPTLNLTEQGTLCPALISAKATLALFGAPKINRMLRQRIGRLFAAFKTVSNHYGIGWQGLF